MINMDEIQMEKYIELIALNEDLLAQIEEITFLVEDENYVQDIIDMGYPDEPKIIATWGGMLLYENGMYAKDFEYLKENSNLSSEEFDFLSIFGISDYLLKYYRKRETAKAYGCAYGDKEAIERYGSKNKAGMAAYDKKYFSISTNVSDMIKSIVEQQNNKKSEKRI